MINDKYRYLFLFLLGLSIQLSLQAQNKFDEYAQAKVYLVKGDYLNAATLLKKLISFDSTDIELKKDLAICYNFQREYENAIQTLKPIVDKDKADDQCFQLLGNSYRALHQTDECKLLFLKGIAKFPDNGPLYNEMADLLWSIKDNTCIKYWEKGIQQDPEYSKNYYNACRYYNNTKESVWCLIYGEVFVNMEPNNSRTPEIKKILVDHYRNILTEVITDSVLSTKNKFTQKYLGTVYKQYKSVQKGINANSLSLLRTKFIIDWLRDDTAEFPHQLFSFHQTLLRNGMFEAYNQWLLGSSDNLDAFNNWTKLHQQEYNEFVNYYKTLIFKMPANQFYNN